MAPRRAAVERTVWRGVDARRRTFRLDPAPLRPRSLRADCRACLGHSSEWPDVSSRSCPGECDLSGVGGASTADVTGARVSCGSDVDRCEQRGSGINVIESGRRERIARRPDGVRPRWRWVLPDSPSIDDLAAAAWVQAYGAAWLGQDWGRLARYLTADVHFVSTESGRVLVGRRAVISHLRKFLAHAEVHEFNATDLRARSDRGGGFVSYRWQLDWTADGGRRVAEGRDLLSLRFIDGDWRMLWRLCLRP